MPAAQIKSLLGRLATGAGTREDAIRFCALKIRLDILGVGKFAPHEELQGYRRKYEWAKGWRKKEVKRNYRQKKLAEKKNGLRQELYQ